MDVHDAITVGLRQRGVCVLTAQEDETRQLTDPSLLDRATAGQGQQNYQAMTPVPAGVACVQRIPGPGLSNGVQSAPYP